MMNSVAVEKLAQTDDAACNTTMQCSGWLDPLIDGRVGVHMMAFQLQRMKMKLRGAQSSSSLFNLNW